MFRSSFDEFRDKLERDRLNPDVNRFFVMSWSGVSYEKIGGQYETIHLKTSLGSFRPFLDLVTLFQVLSTARRYGKKPDVWMTYDFGFVPALWLAHKYLGGKIVMCLNNQPRIYSATRSFGTLKSAYSWLVEKLFSPLVEHYFTINNTMRSYIEDLGVSPAKITVFSMNTIERDREAISAAKPGRIRARYNIPSETKIIMTVARLEAEKNYPRLLELFAGLGPGYFLIALGRGSLLGELTRQASNLGISSRVIFPGFVDRREIWDYYADADVFVLLSKAEALGVVFWEAMYAGVPVVGSEADGIVETIGEDGDRGRIWREVDEQQGFNQKISFCFNESDERSAMIDKAKRFVEEQISNAININDVYEKLYA